MFGIGTFGLLLFQLGWQVSKAVHEELMPQTWPFNLDVLAQSSTWFYALIQVIMSTQIGIGAIPVMTGKFLYKGDAVRMCSLYMCFNFLITIVATAYYMTTFGQHNNSTAGDQPTLYPDLTTITSIYDRAFSELHGSYLRSLIPSLAYMMIVFAGIVSISIAIYTSSRLLKRHPNYIMCLVAMFLSIGFLLCKDFTISRFLDMRWTGLIIICSLVFDIVSITWIYGVKDLSIDLEFSIGRPIMKLWLVLWSCVPLMLIAIVAWFIAMPTHDRIIEPFGAHELIPKWVPIVICLVLIFIISIHETTKQVDYNTFTMIHEATRPAKDYGPADPLVRHAWKQWKSVCDDTGQRDFTLKRRGTKDWTSSIKKGQYSHAKSRNLSNLNVTNCIGTHNKYNVNKNNNSMINNNNNNNHLNHVTATSMTGGSNSPNYSGSVFGDSAIEEDISCGEKYSSTERGDGGSSSRRSSNECNHHNPHQQSDANHQMHHNRLYQHQNQRAQQLINDEIDELNKRNSLNRNYQKVPIRISASNDHQRMIKRNSYLQAQHDNVNDDELIIDDTIIATIPPPILPPPITSFINNHDDDDDDEELIDDENDRHYTSRIEILPPELAQNFTLPPPAQFQAQSTFVPIIATTTTTTAKSKTTKNPLCHLQDINHHQFYQPSSAIERQQRNHHHLINNIHINGEVYNNNKSVSVDDETGSYSTKTTASAHRNSNNNPNSRTPSDAAYNNNWRRLHSAGNGNHHQNNVNNNNINHIPRNHHDEFSTEL